MKPGTSMVKAVICALTLASITTSCSKRRFNTGSNSKQLNVPDGFREFTNLPADTIERLKKHDVWQSFSYSDKTLVFSGITLNTIATNDMKKWKVVQLEATGDGQSGTGLKEITALTITPSDDGESLLFASGEIDLREPLSLFTFSLDSASDQDPKLLLRELEGDKFEIRSAKGTLRIVLMPSEDASASAVPAFTPLAVGAYTAPHAGYKMPLKNVMGLQAKETGYLHHNLSQSMEVLVDESYPSQYLPALDSALGKWNAALGAKLFLRNKNPVKVDLGDCFSSRKMCIRWEGGRDVAWSGVGGHATQSFDPQTGKIVGGYVKFINENSGVLAPSAKEDNDKLLSGKFSMQWLVSTFMRKSEYRTYQHPQPNILVENILLHEIGHFNGHTHNFSGSWTGTIESPTKSIMDYFAFPLVRESAVGPFDLQVIETVYKKSKLASDYTYCSDTDSAGGMSNPSPLLRQANCNQFDVGDALDWYIALAEASKEGVFASQVSNPAENMLFSIGLFLTPAGGGSASQKLKATRYLCKVPGKSDAIASDLKLKLQVVLDCKG